MLIAVAVGVNVLVGVIVGLNVEDSLAVDGDVGVGETVGECVGVNGDVVGNSGFADGSSIRGC